LLVFVGVVFVVWVWAGLWSLGGRFLFFGCWILFRCVALAWLLCFCFIWSCSLSFFCAVGWQFCLGGYVSLVLGVLLYNVV